MKKLFFTLVGMWMISMGYSQIRPTFSDTARIRFDPRDLGELFRPCRSQATLNISTGQNGSGGIIPIGSSDPFWGGVAIDNVMAPYPWNIVNGTAILSPNSGTDVAGVQTFRRYFYVCRQEEIRFQGNYRDDNMVSSFTLKNAANAAIVWNHAPLPTNNPQCYTNIFYSGTVTIPAGRYYFEFVYDNHDGPGGFALQGTLTAPGPILSDYEGCCCDCSQLPREASITGPSCFCTSPNCTTPITFSVPQYGNNTCLQYNWSIQPAVAISGQGTNQISVNCKDWKAGNYTVSVKVTCDKRTIGGSMPVTVCAAPNPSFSMTSNPTNATFTSTVSGTHYWFVVNDNDANCMWSFSESINYIGSNPTASFGTLAPNQQYMVFHVMQNQCGSGCECWSYQAMCFKWLPPQYFKTVGPPKPVKEEMKVGWNDIPEGIRREIEKIRKTNLPTKKLEVGNLPKQLSNQ